MHTVELSRYGATQYADVACVNSSTGLKQIPLAVEVYMDLYGQLNVILRVSKVATHRENA